MQKKLDNRAVVANVEKLSENYVLLEVAVAESQLAEIRPGQFANLNIPGAKDVFLRRPFSIHDVEGNRLKFLIKIIGKGTNAVVNLPLGSQISMVYPLGNGFDLNVAKKALLFGGGCGVAPMLMLAKSLQTQGIAATVVLGGRSAADIVRKAEFAKYAQVRITTEDGSLGTKGYVTDELNNLNLAEYSQWYSCGPEAMQKGLAKLAKQNNVPLQVSLENMMACGFGVCLCCVTKTKQEGHLCVCSEGPVFNVERLEW